MKVAINKCYGGFVLSHLAVQRIAALKGRECHFYTQEEESPYIPISLNEAMHANTYVTAFDVANINEVLPYAGRSWASLTPEELAKDEAIYKLHQFDSDFENRSDPILIQVLEELGDAAVETCLSKIVIVEIPDGVDFYIDHGDGYETIHEKHRSWS